MIGIVVVSHSPALAMAAVDLALEMVHGEKPPIAIAAGAGDGSTGTDAVRVSEAITEVASPDGVLVMMDLGSAVLSAEMSLEFLDNPGMPVKLTSAPFVEGLLAAVVMAAGGATLEAVEAEARGALGAKRSHLTDEGPLVEPVETQPVETRGGDLSGEFTIVNADGMHARPAAMLVGALAPLDAIVTVSNPRTGKPALKVTGPTALLTLGARAGDVLHFSAGGADAKKALQIIGAMICEGFGEPLAVAAGALPPPRTRVAAGPMGVSPGRAVGPVAHMPLPVEEPKQGLPLPEVQRTPEAERIAAAALVVAASLRERAGRVTGEAREILEASAAMAVDSALIEDATARVLREGQSPAVAAWGAISDFAEVLASQGGRMAERVADVQDVRNRLVAAIMDRPAPGVPERSEPFVLIARDLPPADTALLDPAVCLALVTEEGGPTSHTAILARALGIPAIVAAKGALSIPEDTILFVDGTTGRLESNPSPELVAEVAATPGPAEFSGIGATADGHAVQLLANVGSPESVVAAVEARAEGVGLFRTEFCFLNRETAPTIAEQVEAYRPVFAAFPGRKVVVRTLDAGADKPLAFVTDSREENPALGIRGYRTSWRRPELLDDQLAAIALAASEASAIAWVMAPMIATVDETADFVARCRTHGLQVAGVMIETPAAALMAGEISAECDFLSLGTNDLAQYTMAADRLVGDLAPLNDPWQPAVLRLISTTALAGMAAATPVGVCGEAAADPLLAAVLVGLGVTSLSMSPKSIPAVAALLSSLTLERCRAVGVAATSAATSGDARAAVGAIVG